MECKHCKNIFSTKTSLNNHQKTAKYCLKAQKINIESNYKCQHCKQEFIRAYHLHRHQKNCKPNEYIINLEKKILLIENDNKNLTKQLSDSHILINNLQDKLSRPTTSNKTQINNYIQQLQMVTDQAFIDSVPNLTIDHILKGPEGYAQYALEYPLKDRMICVDYARRKVKFKDRDGNIITDPEMTNLTTKLFHSIKDKNKELIFHYGNELKERFGDEMDKIVEILDYKIAVDKGSEGEKSDFHHDFVKQICSQTIKD